jgi:RNA polymerase sigma-70 factor (ECF subfamily)
VDENRYARSLSPDSTLSALEDGALARRIAAAGAIPDSAAETELYRRLAPRVRLYGLRHLREPHAAADLVQQVLLMTLERLRAGEVRQPERIPSFVLGACRMTVIEMKRGARRREALLEAWGGVEEAYEAPEPLALDADRLAACLQALSERERTVVVLTFFVCCGISRLARFNVTSALLTDTATGKVRYFEGTPIPTSLILVLLLAVLYHLGRTGEHFWWGHWIVLGRGFHPIALLFLVSGSLMVSTVRVPKP